MDRRKALSRMATGGATIAGATAILSQPAFAFSNPVVTANPAVSVTTTGARTATIAVVAPTATCPTSATSSATTQISLTWETFWPDGGTVMSTGTGTAVSIPAGFGQWFPNDRIRITLRYRLECVYTGDTAQICYEWFREFQSSAFGTAANWSETPGTGTGPTEFTCPSALLAASRSAAVWYAPGGRPRGGKPVT